jgi:hypothetical protein
MFLQLTLLLGVVGLIGCALIGTVVVIQQSPRPGELASRTVPRGAIIVGLRRHQRRR